ncbi:MAG: GTPase ObgE [Candidatus Moraniibacteriota bacterium]|nr:MAG: GTPase ObgE [Candidatus Moranbacteria bacterium]
MKDLARIYIKAGDGGSGKLSFRHEKFAAKGGPDGGDGGKGGDVIIQADENMENLVPFNFKKRYLAENGEGGMPKKMHGKDRADIVVKVPVGTVVYEVSEDYFEKTLRNRSIFEEMMKERKLLVDMDSHGKEFVGAWGGRGGKGNWHFRSSTNQTPQEFEPGTPGEEKYLLLELKVVADVGIVGLPNVGKSSLLKALTNANPKIAGYPFTTLEPNLGVATVHDRRLVIVDVPGVIEEAWEGKGIGPWFLRHLERCKTLVHVLAPSSSDIETQCHSVTEQLMRDYKIVRNELEKYGKGLIEKPEVVAVNKMELVAESDRLEISRQFEKATGKKLVWVSAGMGEVGDLWT